MKMFFPFSLVVRGQQRYNASFLSNNDPCVCSKDMMSQKCLICRVLTFPVGGCGGGRENICYSVITLGRKSSHYLYHSVGAVEVHRFVGLETRQSGAERFWIPTGGKNCVLNGMHSIN